MLHTSALAHSFTHSLTTYLLQNNRLFAPPSGTRMEHRIPMIETDSVRVYVSYVSEVA